MGLLLLLLLLRDEACSAGVAVQKGVGCLDPLLGRDRCLMMMKALVNSTVQTVEAVKLSVFHNLAEYELFHCRAERTSAFVGHDAVDGPPTTQ
jgi:hypothetical protein